MKEMLWLRCFKCSFEFIKEVETKDKIYEFICPNCKKTNIELSFGKKVKNGKKYIKQP